jgi:hypothetical protein
MVAVDEYFHDLMKKILTHYDIIRKSEEFSDKKPEFSKLQKKIQNYFENHYFIGELEKIKEIYSEDPLRIKHIRNSIINSLQDDKMIFHIREILKFFK